MSYQFFFPTCSLWCPCSVAVWSWCVATLATLRRVQLLHTEAADWLVYLYLYAWRNFWDVSFISSLPFSSKRFLEIFFPMGMLATCPKFGLCWLIPVFDCVLHCVWTGCFTCFAQFLQFLCCPIQFLHIAKSLLYNCN